MTRSRRIPSVASEAWNIVRAQSSVLSKHADRACTPAYNVGLVSSSKVYNRLFPGTVAVCNVSWIKGVYHDLRAEASLSIFRGRVQDMRIGVQVFSNLVRVC